MPVAPGQGAGKWRRKDLWGFWLTASLLFQWKTLPRGIKFENSRASHLASCLVSTSIPSSQKGFYYLQIIHRHEQCLLSPNSSSYQLISGSPYQGKSVHVTFKLLLGSVLDIIVECWLKVTTTSLMRPWVHLVLTWVFSWTGWGISPLLYTIYPAHGGLARTVFNQFLSKHILKALPLGTHPKILVS